MLDTCEDSLLAIIRRSVGGGGGGGGGVGAGKFLYGEAAPEV